MKIALIFPNWTSVFGSFSKVANKASAFPPLNLSYLAAIAEKAGHNVQIIDGEVEGLTSQEIIDRVKHFSPDLVGLTSTTPIFHIASALAKEMKEQIKVPIMIGGAHSTVSREKCFESYFDFMFVGEADLSFGHFLKCFESGANLSEVPGLIYRNNGKIVSTGNSQLITDLDEVPFPARHLLKYGEYKTGTLRGVLNYTSFMFSRGCPFRCVYCCTSVTGTSFRKRSIDKVISEIESIVKNYGIRHLYFVDNVLTMDRNYILRLCDEIDSRGIKITFEGGTRANLVDEEMIARLAKSGLIRISFGLESADPQIQKIIKKEVSLESYVKANKLTNKYGIETINSVMLGLPGETKESIQKTITFLRNSKEIQHATYSIATPYPGTEFYEMAKKGEHGLKLLTKDFSKYQRYGSAAISVNDLSPEDLVRFQKIGLLKIYLSPWRIWPALKRFGFFALLPAFLSSISEYLRGPSGKESGGQR